MSKLFFKKNQLRNVLSDSELNDRTLILSAKEKLENIMRDNTSPTSINRSNLKNLLFEIANILKKSNLSPNCKVASWLLLADVYGFLSIQWSSASMSHAEHSFHEAIKCLENLQQISMALPKEPILDTEFIKRCNTFNVANADSAMEILKYDILSELKLMSTHQTLIKSM